jgi:hypothetical protein
MDAIVALRDQLLAQVSTAVAGGGGCPLGPGRHGQRHGRHAAAAGPDGGHLKRRLLDPLGATVQVLHAMARNDHTGPCRW